MRCYCLSITIANQLLPPGRLRPSLEVSTSYVKQVLAKIFLEPCGQRWWLNCFCAIHIGTFGRVLECWDREKKAYCAIKVIRNVQKYRDAAMIEVLRA